jgi:two-component system phosphate regulon sensor histidine kinase PhoR
LAELEEAETQRAKLLRVTTHELRSPITVAQSLLRNVLRGYAGPLSEVQKDIFTRVSGQLDFLGTLVNDFLDLTASRAPARAADEGPVVLNVSLARVVLVLQPRADEKGITILFRQWREELAVWATEDALDHIFTNLVDNAVKYTPRDGRVTVALSQVGDQAQVIISDTGIGIPPESLPHLFEEFYRAPNARAFKAIGTGLGLAIVKGLVDRYRGKIAVESTVGQGTAFTVTFPLYIHTR